MANDVFNAIRLSSEGTKKSYQWYQSQVRKFQGLTSQKLLSQGKLVNRILPGEMYMFRYDPKLKDTLPYYDKFPLVLPFRRLSNGFLGLNLHYLPYAMRFKILGYLSQYADDENVNEDTRLRISWRILESSAKLTPVKFCVKHYLLDHIQTRFLKIPYPDWLTASQLPVERFVNEEKSTVWRETRKKYL